MSEDPLRKLAQEQQRLIGALTGDGQTPDGFDTPRVRLSAEVIASKRRHGIERTWPAMVASLGDRWTATYATYARSHPLPPGGSPFDDGLALARRLCKTGALPDEGRLELAMAEARLGMPLQLARLPQKGRVALVVRIGRHVKAITFPTRRTASADFSHSSCDSSQ